MVIRYLGFLACSLVAGWVAAQTPVECAAIDSDAERLICYDALYPTPSTEAGRQTAPSAESVPGDTRADPIAYFGVEQIHGGRPADAQLLQINSTIASLSVRPDQEMVFALENGQIWAQTSPRYLTIHEDDAVIVRRARMGGYILSNERGAATRVTRLK